MFISRQLLIGVVLLWLSGAALRVTILAVPPVIPVIQAELQMSGTQVGVLSGLPVVLFALAALPGSLLISRLGPRMTLVGGLLVLAVGGALRAGSSNVVNLYAMTTMMGVGVAIAQTGMAVLVREWLPNRIAFGTAVYSNGLLMGEILPVWLAAPILMPLFSDSWRLELAAWSVPVVCAAMIIMALAPRGCPSANGATAPAWLPDWTNGLIWRLGLMFGSINATYYASNSFLPAYLHSVSRDDLIHGALTALNLAQLPASLLILATADRLARSLWPYLTASAVMMISVTGLVFMVGAWTIIWAALFGFASGAAFVLALTLPPLLSKREDIARNSAAIFTLSYAIAVAITVTCGAVWDLTGISSSAFAPIALCTISLSLLALMLKTKRQLD